MLDRYEVRTDLALEEKEKFESDDVEVKGVILEEDYDAEREIQMTGGTKSGSAGRILPQGGICQTGRSCEGIDGKAGAS